MVERNAAISSVMKFICSVSVDKEVQLSLLAGTLVTACVDAGISKERALEAIEVFFDASGDLVSLERPRLPH